MKELEQPKIDIKQQEIVKPYETQQAVNSLKKAPGHKIWELDLVTGFIGEAEVREVVGKIGLHGTAKVHNVIKKPNCLYCSALNAKNADKHFLRAIAVAI